MVNCSWCEERFARFVDGACTDAERSCVLAHVDGCAACRGLLEELRVVDALLIGPRAVELPADFTSATMADVQALPLPLRRRPPLLAWLVSFIVAAWSLIGAASLIAPNTILAAGETAVDGAHVVLMTLAGIGRVFGHLFSRGDLSSWTTVAGGIVVADALVLLAVIAALRFVRPRVTERARL
jgi:anti-sigma factor RsiW